MKKILFSLLILCIAVTSYTQSLPIDPQIRYGKLPNGLTYYIRKNQQPSGRADFYIAQRVGSMLEEDNQAGLAHFLEHMAFNGTKNFPDKALMNYLQSIGVRFGENLNAYTSFDETVYLMTNVPTSRETIIDSCLLILHDWSSFILLDSTEIDKERGVIREEWRTRGNAQFRIWEKQLPDIYPNSRYGKRLPIGSIDVINNFKHQEIRDYYHKWYRPDLQGIIVVGDLDVDKTEAALKQTFADIVLPANPAKREYEEIADNEKPIISVVTDKEQSYIALQLYYKHNQLPMEVKGTMIHFTYDYLRWLSSYMIIQRLSEIQQKADAPFLGAYAYDGDFLVAKTKAAWTVYANAKESKITDALKAMVIETRRAKEFGFLPSEYERAKAVILKRYETEYNEREKQKNSKYTREYVSHFTDGGYIPGPEVEYKVIQQFVNEIPLVAINQFLKDIIHENNVVLTVIGPEKEGLIYPTEQELLNVLSNANQESIKPYEETVSNEPLVKNLPAPGKIAKKVNGKLFGETVYTLSNGIKVITKNTPFKKEQILMNAFSFGGSSLYGEKDFIQLKALSQVAGLGGWGNFSRTDLNKVLAGKEVWVSPSVNLETENMNGSSTPKDLETFFQLVYLQFTAPRKDQEPFDAYISRLKTTLENRSLDPMATYNDSIFSAMYGNNLRLKSIRLEDVDKINYDRILEIYKERFKDAGDFTFTFVGNIDPQTFEPLMIKYLSALPKTNRKETADNKINVDYRKGNYVNYFDQKMENPKASVMNMYWSNSSYTLESRILSTMTKQILDLIYVETIREQEGGTYGVSVQMTNSQFPTVKTLLLTIFDTDTAKWKYLNDKVKTELQKLAKEGPSDKDFQKTVENLRKRISEDKEENNYWLNIVSKYYQDGFDGYTNYEKTLNSITKKTLQQYLSQFLSANNSTEVVMIGKPK